MGWWMVVYWIATLILSEVLRPKVNTTNVDATAAEEADMPSVTTTDPIPVIWGKVRLRDPHLVWYGDYFTIPIKKKAGKGGFLGTGKTIWQTVGYRYYWGQHLALCHGIATLHRVWSEEREIWSGTNTGGGIAIDNEALYGGEDNAGGVAAACNFLPGSQTQIVDPYLAKMLTSVPAYRGVASFVWYGPSMNMSDAASIFGIPFTAQKQSGYIGTSAVPRTLSFELSRYPQVLNAAKAVIGEDANPAEVIYECLTTDPNGPEGWGMGLSPAMIDVAAFKAAASTLYDEGFGISLIWKEQTSVEEVIAAICKTIDAVCYRDFRTGLYTFKLIRGGYTVASLPVLDSSNILELENFSQPSLDGTTNDVKINFTSRALNYKKVSAQAQDLANMRTQGDIVSTSQDHLCVTLAALADRIANRELFAGSVPIAKCDVTVNREAYAYGPGDLFVVTWPDLGINNIVMRVQKTAIGLPKANRIRMSLVQDVFNLGSASYSVPGGGGTSWTDPISNPIPITTQKVMELPYFFNKDFTQASYMVCAQRPNSGCVTFEVWEKLHSESDYTYRDTCLTYTPSGILVADYKCKPTVETNGPTLATNADLNSLGSATDDALRNGANLACFESGEFFAFHGFTDNGNGTITLNGIWAGLFDTVPSQHTAGERVWFFTYGASNPEDKVSQTAQIDVKGLPYGPRGAITLDQAAVATASMSGRNKKPYPPGNMQVNGAFGLSSVVGLCQPTWGLRNKTLHATIRRQDDASDESSEGTYNVNIYIGGVIRRSYSNLAAGEQDYSPAMRIADDSNGGKLVEVQVQQATGTDASQKSAFNSTGAFQMSGFGMCFGQLFGGIQQ